MNSNDENSADAAIHSQHIQETLTELIDHMRSDVARVPEPRFQALLETGAEVLDGLRTAYEQYDYHTAKAWEK